MRLRALFLGLGIVAVGLCAARPAHACSCLPTNPCETASRSGTVFTGIVSKISEESEERVVTLGARQVRLTRREIVVRFQVQKVFKGLPLDQKTVEVRTAPEDGMCGVTFKAGKTYLVYAHRREADGLLDTDSCSRTRPLAEAKDDIPLIETFLAGKRRTAILGTVSVRRAREQTAWLDRSLAEGMEVEVRGTNRTYKATVDREGKFRILDVPEGSYTTRAVMSSAYPQFDAPHQFSIRAGACSADTYAIFAASGVISGRVLYADGKQPAAGTRLSLLDFSPRSRKLPVVYARTDDAGRYRFDQLLPGRYLVSTGDFRVGVTLDLRSNSGAGVDIQLENR
jgi:hypothetical protein